jgi:hypothetical protein
VKDPTWAVLAALLYLQIKHFVCDYPLQTTYQVVNTGTYGHPGGILHAGIHAIFTIPVFLIMAPPLAVGIAIVAAEFVVHYHIDWAKQQIMARAGWQSVDSEFWWGIGADQFLHYLTYLVIATVLWRTTF